MIELKAERGTNHKLFDNGDGTRTLKSSNNLHYANLDLVGDGADDRLRTVDKNLIWTGSKWVYDYAEERVVIPKTLDTNNIFSFKQAGSQSELVFEGINAVGVRTDNGMYGYDQVEYPDTPVAGVSMILTPSRIGLVKLYKIPTSMLPLDLSIPVAGDTEFVSEFAGVWDSTRINALPVTVSIETIAGQKYIKKEIPALDTQDEFVYSDATLVAGASTWTTGHNFAYAQNPPPWVNTRNQLTAPVWTSSNILFAQTIHNSSNNTYAIGRGATAFDTSAIGAGTITAAQVKLYQTSVSAGASFQVQFVDTHFASDLALVPADFDHVQKFGTPGVGLQPSDGLGPLFGDASGLPKFITNVLTNISTINPTGITTFGMVHTQDISNSTPPNGTNRYCIFDDHAAAISPPELTVTFTPAVAPTGLPSDGMMFRSAIGGGQKLLMNAGYLNNGLTRR